MYIYVLIYLILAALGVGLSKRGQRQLLPIILIACFWFMGWRFEVGCDFTGYLNRYDRVSRYANPWDVLWDPEPAFLFITTYLKVNGFPYVYLNIVSSAIIILAYHSYLRISRQPLAEWAFLFPIIILQLSMSGLRQGIAVAMLTAACGEFLRGRRVSAGLWILLGAQFHTSVAVFLPIAFLAGRQVSVGRLIVGVVILSPIAGYLIGAQAGDYVDQYVDQIYGEMSSGGAAFRYLTVLLPALFFLWKKREFQEKLPNSSQLYMIFALATIAVAPLFAISSLIVHRVSFYLMPVSAMIFGDAWRVRVKGVNADMIRMAPFILYGVYLVGWLYFSRHAEYCYVPYQSYSFL